MVVLFLLFFLEFFATFFFFLMKAGLFHFSFLSLNKFDANAGMPKMGDEMVVVESESKARAIVAQRKKVKEFEELEQQVSVLSRVYPNVSRFLFLYIHLYLCGKLASGGIGEPDAGRKKLEGERARMTWEKR